MLRGHNICGTHEKCRVPTCLPPTMPHRILPAAPLSISSRLCSLCHAVPRRLPSILRSCRGEARPAGVGGTENKRQWDWPAPVQQPHSHQGIPAGCTARMPGYCCSSPHFPVLLLRALCKDSLVEVDNTSCHLPILAVLFDILNESVSLIDDLLLIPMP